MASWALKSSLQRLGGLVSGLQAGRAMMLPRQPALSGVPAGRLPPAVRAFASDDGRHFREGGNHYFGDRNRFASRGDRGRLWDRKRTNESDRHDAARGGAAVGKLRREVVWYFLTGPYQAVACLF